MTRLLQIIRKMVQYWTAIKQKFYSAKLTPHMMYNITLTFFPKKIQLKWVSFTKEVTIWMISLSNSIITLGIMFTVGITISMQYVCLFVCLFINLTLVHCYFFPICRNLKIYQLALNLFKETGKQKFQKFKLFCFYFITKKGNLEKHFNLSCTNSILTEWHV